jgi:hypothetical protein
MTHDEAAMVRAHKEGRKAFHDGASEVAVRHTAISAFETQDERDAFIAGYLGDERRERQINILKRIARL